MVVFNARNYKLSKIYIKDLDVIIAETQRAINGLAPYARYKSVGRLLRQLKEELAIQKTHKNNCDVIVKAKGAVAIDK
jgi:hypothetical protein